MVNIMEALKFYRKLSYFIKIKNSNREYYSIISETHNFKNHTY